MTAPLYPSSDSRLTYETDSTVYFFSGPFDPLNNFSAHTVTIWGVTFQTVEHAFQWKKFADTKPVLAKQIAEAGSPWLAKQLANTEQSPEDWPGIRVKVMTEIVTAKVEQHQDVREILLATGRKQIVENSPVDSFWGGGQDGKGETRWARL